MKKRTEKIFLSILVILQIVLFFVMIIFAVTLTLNLSKGSKEMLNQQALNISEEHMRERVENIIHYLDAERENSYYEAVSLGDLIYQNLFQVDENKLEGFLTLWSPIIKEMEHGELMQLILYNETSDEYSFYYDGKLQENTVETTNEEILSYIKSCPYHREIIFPNYTLYITSGQKSIDDAAKARIYEIIHLSLYGEDGYVWVNEVLNFEGGENYAIRRIHPNLKDTEGQYLSTDMQDAMGNYPYLRELEEIKKEGEIFHTSYFKNKSNDIITEKASYAKLYEPFQWIIATGDPLDDVLVYSSSLEQDNKSSLMRALMRTILILLTIFLGDIILIIFNDKKLKERLLLEENLAHKELMIQKADFESMTGLLRKVPGEQRIKDFIQNSPVKSGILITLDLDDLKGINDTLGHKVGDDAIIGIADTLKTHFRQSDILIRSGGDEFIVFLPKAGENVDAVKKSMDTLLRKISSITIGENKERSIHCSAGFTKLYPEDTYETFFSRADKALYHVKRNGKNNFAFYVPEMEKADFEFKNKKLLSTDDLHRFHYDDLKNLLYAISDFYELVVSVNITQDNYYIMEAPDFGVFSKHAVSGPLHEIVENLCEAIHPQEQILFKNTFFKQGLMETYKKGKHNFSYRFTLYDGTCYRSAECIVIFYTNSVGDICDYTMARWMDDAPEKI